MIAVIEGPNGYTIAHNGQVLTIKNEHGHYVPAHFTGTEVAGLCAALANVPTPVGTGAVTPAKAMARMRARPPIKRYPGDAA